MGVGREGKGAERGAGAAGASHEGAVAPWLRLARGLDEAKEAAGRAQGSADACAAALRATLEDGLRRQQALQERVITGLREVDRRVTTRLQDVSPGSIQGQVSAAVGEALHELQAGASVDRRRIQELEEGVGKLAPAIGGAVAEARAAAEMARRAAQRAADVTSGRGGVTSEAAIDPSRDVVKLAGLD